MTKELTFEEQQAIAYAFLDAFYNRADFGYDVKRWTPDDVNQKVMDIVNDMGNRIVLNSRVTTISPLLATIGETMAIFPSFWAALFVAIVKDEIRDVAHITSVTKQSLIKEYDRLRKNRLAWAVITQIMASEKQNIEMAFLDY